MQHELNRRLELERRLEQAVGDEFGNDVGDPDDQLRRTAGRTTAQRVHHLAPGRKDLFGVAIDELAGLGEHQGAALAREEIFVEGGFQFSDLPAERRLREMQHLGGLRDAAFFGDRVEAEQVVIVQPFHDATSYRFSRL